MKERGGREKERKRTDIKRKRRKEEEKRECCPVHWERDSLDKLETFKVREGEFWWGETKVNLVLYTHALQIILSGSFTYEPNTV